MVTTKNNNLIILLLWLENISFVLVTRTNKSCLNESKNHEPLVRYFRCPRCKETFRLNKLFED